jgi:hypothetical protein
VCSGCTRLRALKYRGLGLPLVGELLQLRELVLVVLVGRHGEGGVVVEEVVVVQRVVVVVGGVLLLVLDGGAVAAAAGGKVGLMQPQRSASRTRPHHYQLAAADSVAGLAVTKEHPSMLRLLCCCSFAGCDRRKRECRVPLHGRGRQWAVLLAERAQQRGLGSPGAVTSKRPGLDRWTWSFSIMPKALSVWPLCDAHAGNISGRQRLSILSAKHCDTSYIGTMKPPPLPLHHGVAARELPGDYVHIQSLREQARWDLTLGGGEAGGVLDRFGGISIGVRAFEFVAGAASSPNTMPWARCSKGYDISPKPFDELVELKIYLEL